MLSIEQASFMNNHDLIAIHTLKCVRRTFCQVIWSGCYGKQSDFSNSIGLESQFTKYDSVSSDTLNTPYDYHSVMHYRADSFTSNGLPTIVPVQPNVKIGQSYFLSATDIAAIRQFYSCSGVGTTLPPPTIPTTTREYFQREPPFMQTFSQIHSLSHH